VLHKVAIKAFIYSWHLGFVWEALRDTAMSRVMIAALVLCLLAERFFGRRRNQPIQRSFFFDYGYLVFNAVAMGGLVTLLYQAIHRLYGMWMPFTKIQLLKGQPFALQVLIGFLIGDFTQYFSHWLRHKVSPLWHIHAVHHSEKALNPAAAFRTHPFDPVASAAIRYVPVVMLGGSAWAGAFLGAFEVVWAAFLHSDLPISLGPLKWVLITPAFHRIHHSIEERHWDKNLGEVLTVWDVLFGTACFDLEDSFELGVRDFPIEPVTRLTPWALVTNWLRLTWYPFQALGAMILKGASGG
jgi:sterol desaturase/sphingolipid hydroxylase (fatty acid hydroxylase superfamily)